MQGNGYIIIYTELMITAILQDFVPLGKIVNLKSKIVTYNDIKRAIIIKHCIFI